MTTFEPVLLSSIPANGVVPVDPGLAIWIIVIALLVSVLALSLAVAPPSGLLKRISLSSQRKVARAAASA